MPRPKEAEVEVGERIETQIGDVAFGGDGVARHEQRVVFVPFTVDGDQAEIEITEVRKRYARGKLIRVMAASPYRAAPLCRFFSRCGGCRMQHISYDHQLEIKGRQVAEAFSRIGGFPRPPVAPVIASPRSYGYRGKAEFHLACGPKRAGRIGLMAMASHELIEVERCEIVDESINRKLGLCREALRQGRLSPRDERLILWADEEGEPLAALPIASPEIARIVEGKRMAVPSGGFFQANSSLVGELVRQVRGLSSLTGRETVLDVYAGSGLFSLFLGSLSQKLFGIEGDAAAARCARMNLAREGLGHAEWFTGDAAAVIRETLAPRGVKAGVVVLDPPRDGCGPKVLEALLMLGPQRIVYVSCNPATQARDCRLLADKGYALRRLQPLDMFPQTAHIEVVALLTGAGSGDATQGSGAPRGCAPSSS